MENLPKPVTEESHKKRLEYLNRFKRLKTFMDSQKFSIKDK